MSLKTKAVGAEWSLQDLSLTKITDGWNGESAVIHRPIFSFTLRGGRSLIAAQMSRQSKPASSAASASRNSPRASDRLGGRQLSMDFVDMQSGLKAHWTALAKDGANYVRQIVTFTAGSQAVDLAEIRMVDMPLPGGAVTGTAEGSPVATETMFAGLEHPMSASVVKDGNATCSIKRNIPLQPGQSVTYSSVVGVSPRGQLRRGFLRYVERERAHPYRPFLHYNSWYDLGYFNRFNEKECVDAIKSFGEELVKKRGVKMDSFLFDDGWDDTSTVWEFHKGFPNGFTPLKNAAAEIGAAPGIWLSPWGGYGDPRTQRLATGKAQGYEIDSQGYALSGPKYYARFRQVCLDLVNKYGINQFKLDGTGSPDKQYPGSAFASDFEAAISLIGDLRKAKPDLFINLTTGTWPSPFWTQYADSIWRGGSDHSFAGVGPFREKWITYRDGDTYRGIAKRGPLYPLNSLMLHGIIYAKHAQNLNTDPADSFKHEVRDYFGTGTQLQEMYISPSLLTPKNWDDLAQAAKWSRANASVLVDTHWVGGDPNKLEVYGWGSWSPKKGILVLRNPSDKPQSYSVDIAAAFQLPRGMTGTFSAKSAYADEPFSAEFTIGKSKVVDLQPFQVLVLEAVKK